MFLTGCSPKPQCALSISAAASGAWALRDSASLSSASKFVSAARSDPRSGRSGSGKSKRCSIQSFSRSAIAPAPRAESLRPAVIFESDRKLATSGVGTSGSSPKKNASGNRSVLAILQGFQAQAPACHSRSRRLIAPLLLYEWQAHAFHTSPATGERKSLWIKHDLSRAFTANFDVDIRTAWGGNLKEIIIKSKGAKHDAFRPEIDLAAFTHSRWT